MPQLDTLSFFPQFFWLTIFYFGFYILLVKYFLPRMGRIIKIRNLKMNAQSLPNSGNSSTSENAVLSIQRDQSLALAIKQSKHLFQEKNQSTLDWSKSVCNNIGKEQFKDLDRTYKQSISDLSTKQGLILQNLKQVVSPQSFQISGIQSTASPARDTFFTALIHHSLSR